MELDMESMKKLKRTVKKCIAELGKKDDLTPQETKAALDGAMLYDWLCEQIEDGETEEEYSERGSSRRGSRRSNRSYGGSYGSYGSNGSYENYGMPYYGERGFYQGGYPMPMPMMNDSMRGSYDGSYESYNSGRRRYSRHSIGDRAVEKLENLMDSAGSEYEKEQLHKYIRMIRAAAEEE